MRFSLCILDFIGKVSPPDVPSFHESLEQVVIETFEKKDLRGMRMLLKDVTEWALNLNMKHQEELNRILIGNFGKGLR